jgi:hypothetical protein
MFIKSNKWTAAAGLITGAVLGVAKFGSNALYLRKTLGADARTGRTAAGGIAAFLISQLIMLPLLILAYFLSFRLFCGFIAGSLLVPAIIMVNSITEALGLTKNGFE